MQWLDPGILGDHDNPDEKTIHPMSWCLAKIMLLFDQSHSLIPPPSNVDKNLQKYFRFARELTGTTRGINGKELILQIPPFEEWARLALQEGVPKAVLDVIRSMAVLSPTKRPSALQVLTSREFKALEGAAATYGL